MRIFLIFFFSANVFQLNAQNEILNKKIEIHGHRGFRGHFPENTITAFKEAAKLGVFAIEFDIVISKDSQVVISHEPWFNYKTCTEPTGENVKMLKQHNLHQLTYEEIKKIDCGKRGNKKFPDQAKIPEYKPLLKDVIAIIENFTKENNLPSIHYTIEIKCEKHGDGKWHPKPAVITKLLYEVIEPFHIEDRIMIQSFDVRSLKLIQTMDTSIKIGLLIANLHSVHHNIKKLGFAPYAYNPPIKLAGSKTIQDAHKNGCKVIVWTVNSETDMKKLIFSGVDGLITDYPNVALSLH